MREILATSVNAKSLEQKEELCALDRVRALGIAAQNNPIGVSALHFKDGLQAGEYSNIIYSLSRKAGQRMKCDKRTLMLVCKQVVFEDTFSFCWDCCGRKEMMLGAKNHRCESCGGTGLKKHTDYERAKGIGVSEEIFAKHWAKRYQEVQRIYTGEQKDGMRIVKEKIHG